jgi:archaellum component FlaC
MDFSEQLSEFELYNDVKKIKSTLQYIDDDIANVTKKVIDKSYKYQIPNLFEKLTLFGEELKAIKKRLNKIMDQIDKFDKQLISLKECDTSLCDSAYLERYQDIKKLMEEFKADYKALKSKIILYTDSLG